MPNILAALRRMDQPTTIQEMVEVKKYEMAFIAGHCGKDPSTRTTVGGKSITSVSVAVSWGKRGEPDQKTEWVEVLAWENQSTVLSQFKKGDAIMAAGMLSLNRYTGNDGVERVTGQITAWEIAKPERVQRDQPPQQQSKPSGATTPSPGSQSGMPPAGGGMPEDPEIPFAPHIW